MTGVYKKTVIFLEMIKFSHTIFALPFAFSAAFLAANGLPSTRQLLFIALAMVGARTAAMSLNRLIDAKIDAKNPRTATRALPAGALSPASVLIAIIASTGLLFYAAYQLNPLCFILSPVALGFLVLYSYCKRFTSLAHVVLGICLAGAPIGAWIALRGSIDPPAITLGLLVLFWVAGFDILYALQDLSFDRESGLHSIPVKFGVQGSLWTARIFHLLTVVLFFLLMQQLSLGSWFLAGIICMTGMLLYEHWLLRAGDLSKLDAAFFTMNGYISITFLVSTVLDIFLKG
ncbi:MAG: UbiA-like polyprenyltransferase [Trichlorobacter sp.]|jgi:4-hydroxybenzoate polyprenyltransferase